MTQSLVDKIAAAVLYEGYILYPYRPAVKNRQRWTFGGLYPQAYGEATGGAEPSSAQTECLVRGDGGTEVTVRVRFLYLVTRTAGELPEPVTELPAEGEPNYRPVDALRVGDCLLQTWQEAVEREVTLPTADLNALRPGLRHEFAFADGRQFEPVRGPAGDIVGVLVREQESVTGCVDLSAVDLDGGLFRVTARVTNLTPLADAGGRHREEALLCALVSTHTILNVRGGAFVSLIDPPEGCREAAASCRNVGVWPVLVGAAGQTDTMLSAPIILYDYPQVAPESPGDLFDGTEIDEILTLRILTLTEDEKREAAAVDERARALLERTEALAREQLLGLHGSVRQVRPSTAEAGDG